ncbi:MAG: FHA domain-containing protein [Planctomycetaceae bacterium]|nr:FHA domain-containing protein [Planctomycetaceae bacterium]
MAIPEKQPDTPELSVNPTDMEAPMTDPVPFLHLEICRGKTSYPKRPVCSPNFVIGSGPSCDLRLGGEEIPDAHAVLIGTETDVYLQWLGEAPELLLNGEPIQEAIVSDGDQIGIGRFEFIVHRQVAQQVTQETNEEEIHQESADPPMETSSLMNLLTKAKADESEEENLSELSASELVAELEATQESVDEFEAAIRQGEEALLFAAAQRAADLSEDLEQVNDAPSEEQNTAEDEAAEAEILDELEKVIHQLSGFSSELDERAARLADQEATQAEAADLLLETQKELAAQLERFHQQVSENQASTPAQEPSQPTLRKAA